MGRSSSGASSAGFNYGDVTFLDSQTTAFWSLWVNVYAWNSSFQTVFQKAEPVGSTNGGWIIQRNGTTDTMQIGFRGGAGGGTAIVGTGGYQGLGWMHCAAFTDVTVGVTNPTRLYRKGVQENLGDVRDAFKNTAVNMSVAIDNSGIAVAELAIWRGITLTQAQALVVALAAGRNPLAMAQLPVFYDPLTEGASTGATTLSDIAGVITPVITATTPATSVLSGPAPVDPPPFVPQSHDNMQPWRGVNWLIKT